MTLSRSFTIKWHSPLNLNRQDTFRELFISIVRFRLTSVKQICTNGRSVKTIQQSNDLIGLESNFWLKKLTNSNGHNAIKWKYFDSAILKYAIHSDFSLSLFVSWKSCMVLSLEYMQGVSIVELPFPQKTPASRTPDVQVHCHGRGAKNPKAHTRNEVFEEFREQAGFCVLFTRNSRWVSPSDFVRSYICCSTRKTKRYVFFLRAQNGF